ncbi:MAG: alpha/beta hydrolase-fold protein [Lysobacterales bacterium]
MRVECLRSRLWQTGILTSSLLLTVAATASEGVLGENQRIFSTHLGYELQYRVYKPAGTTAGASLPTLYVTDGQSYLAQGNFKAVLDDAIRSGMVEPVLVIFLDSRNPDNLEENRRHSEFMCNVKYANFFGGELIPTINSEQPVSMSREDRVILGVSFGGLNGACFGLVLSELFSGIAMQSPASGEHLDVVGELYEKEEHLPLKMFLSVGSRNDNTRAVKRFRKTLEHKGYDVTFIKVQGEHNWKNWTPLLNDVFLTFFATGE